MFEDMVSFWIAMGVLAGLAMWVPCLHGAAHVGRRLRIGKARSVPEERVGFREAA